MDSLHDVNKNNGVVHTIVNPERGIFCALTLGFDAAPPIITPAMDAVRSRYGTPHHRFSYELSVLQAYVLGRTENGACDIVVRTSAEVKLPALFEADPSRENVDFSTYWKEDDSLFLRAPTLRDLRLAYLPEAAGCIMDVRIDNETIRIIPSLSGFAWFVEFKSHLQNFVHNVSLRAFEEAHVPCVWDSASLRDYLKGTDFDDLDY